MSNCLACLPSLTAIAGSSPTRAEKTCRIQDLHLFLSLSHILSLSLSLSLSHLSSVVEPEYFPKSHKSADDDPDAVDFAGDLNEAASCSKEFLNGEIA